MAINKANIALKDDATAGYKNVTAAPISKVEDNTTKKEITEAVAALESEKFNKADNLSDGDATAIKTNLGLANVENTADADKPVSDAVNARLENYYAKANNLSDGNSAAIKTNLALENVNNTSDAQKPVSNAVSNLVGLLNNLQTTNKTSIVNAINELANAIQGLTGLKAEDIDTVAELNAILTDADILLPSGVLALIAGSFGNGFTNNAGVFDLGNLYLSKDVRFGGDYAYTIHLGDLQEYSPLAALKVFTMSGAQFETEDGNSAVIGTDSRIKSETISLRVYSQFEAFILGEKDQNTVKAIKYQPRVLFELGESHGVDEASNRLNGIWRYASNQTISDPKDLVHKLHLDNAISAAITTALANYVTTTQYNSDKKFRGSYTSLANLNSAVPSGTAGDYADVDAGTGSNAQRYIWDVNDAIWVKSEAGAGGAQSVNGQLPDGSGNIALALAQLNGITLTNLQTGDVIRFNGAEFENVAGETLYSSPLNKDASEALGSSIDFSAANFQPKTLADTTTINSIANPSLGVIVIPITGGNSVGINPALIPADRIAGSFNPSKATNILKIVCYDSVAPSFYAIWDLEGGGGGSAYLSADKVSSQAPTTSISDIINYEAAPILKGDSDVVFDNTAGTFTLKANKDYEIVVSGNYVADSGSTRSTIEMFLTDSTNTEIWNAGVYIRDAGDKALISFNRPIKVGASDLTIKFRHIIAKGGAMPINLTKLNITIRS